MHEAAMPTSEKQIEANRRNALLCTGPRTPEGKQRSALNACRHAFTGQVVIMTAEEQAAFTAFPPTLSPRSIPKAPSKPSSPSASQRRAGA